MIRDVLSAAKALSDRTRLRILMALDGRELCVCQVIELLRLAPATVSKHLSILYQAGFVESRKAGRWVYYRLETDARSPLPSGVLFRRVRASLQADDTIQADARKLASILRIDPETLCKQRSGKRQGR
ncbi:MAG: winged helix-turn-helix transcriptional regulator [Nitrospirae bacterium]|nr:winged helix-turn-helix transcriptional regulator [Nitrospirota bacterium]